MIGRRMVAATAVIAAVAAGGVAGAVIGIPGSSGASTPSSTPASTPKSSTAPHARHGLGRGGFGPAIGADKDVLAAAAKALKLSTQDLLKQLSDGKTTIADVAQTQGVDVQTVIKAMEDVADTDISNLVNNPFPAPPTFKGGPKPSAGGPPKVAPGFGFGFQGLGGNTYGAVAKALNISTKDLFTDLGKGQSIADIAKAKGVDVNTLITTLVGDAQSKFDAAVKAHHLSQDQATKLETNLKSEITDLVNNTGVKGMGPFGGFGRRGHGGPGGSGGPHPSTTPTTAAPAV